LKSKIGSTPVIDGSNSWPSIVYTSTNDWARLAADTIDKAVRSVLDERDACSLMLTGGRSAALVYSEWASSRDFPPQGTVLFFGDERCVSPDHRDSNYGLTVKTLFPSGLPLELEINRMEAEGDDLEMAAKEYEACLPRTIDVLLLGLGSDGHIASLFPGSSVFSETDQLVVPVTDSPGAHNRLTITPSVVNSAHQIFLLAPGEEKGRVLRRALRDVDDVSSLPVRMTLRGTWLLDVSAAKQVNSDLDDTE